MGKNTGPYRKLLPLLKDKWDEDCIIITLDDDVIYYTKLIKNLVNDYNKHKCSIGYRGFTPYLINLKILVILKEMVIYSIYHCIIFYWKRRHFIQTSIFPRNS